MKNILEKIKKQKTTKVKKLEIKSQVKRYLQADLFPMLTIEWKKNENQLLTGINILSVGINI